MGTKKYKNWWLLTLKGLFAIVFGIFALFVPNVTLTVLMEYFGILVLLSGLFLVIGSLTHMKSNRHWTNWFFEGILDIIVGGVIMLYPGLTLDLFIILLGIWAVTVGFAQMFNALNAHRSGRAKWLMLLNALVVIVFGLVLFINPTESELALTYLVGAFSIAFGLLITVYSFQLQKL